MDLQSIPFSHSGTYPNSSTAFQRYYMARTKVKFFVCTGKSAQNGTRTRDLILTKDVLYRLSYLGNLNIQAGNETRTHNSHLGRVELYH